ncbi:hypothetical protein C8Q74DRAFT_191853 [Fomes fomentarius]|nr:hypothetical protein C8Q74DRAFT_191853 [Fomes fomentarius]
MITEICSLNLTSLSAVIDGIDIRRILPPLETLVALPAVQSLQRFHLYLHFDTVCGDRNGEGMDTGFSDLAHSILSLPSLEDVCLWISRRTFSLSDVDIVLIQSAWLRLRRLSLSFEHHASEPVHFLRPSLLALVDLALARPQLETLDIDIEVAGVTEDDLIQLETIATGAPGLEHPTTLTWLTFARDEYRVRITFPTDIPRLARALHRLFPMVGGLGRPVIKKNTNETMYDLWEHDETRHGSWRSSRVNVRASSLCFLRPDDLQKATQQHVVTHTGSWV